MDLYNIYRRYFNGDHIFSIPINMIYNIEPEIENIPEPQEPLKPDKASTDTPYEETSVIEDLILIDPVEFNEEGFSGGEKYQKIKKI